MGFKNCSFVKLLVIATVFKSACGILRNPITDRCIHIGQNGDTGEMTVSAQQCTFINIEKGKEGNSDQWLEVVPLDKHDAQALQHTIQKHTNQEVMCFLSQKDSITVGNCQSSHAILLVKEIQGTRANYESTYVHGPLFTIRQLDTNKCLTVLPGDSKLHFTNCSENIPLQRWSTCRHVDKCDVEITWSPAKIVFPKSNASSVSNNSGAMKPSTVPSPTIALSTSETNDEKTSLNVIISEPLYFVFNGLTSIKLPEAQLVQIIAKFYSSQELQEALNLLKEHFVLPTQIDPRSISVQKSMQIVNLMVHITRNKMNSGAVFVSRNLARVPPIYSIKAASAVDEGWKPDVAKLEKIKNNVDSSITSMQDGLNNLKSTILSDISQLANNASDLEKLNLSSEPQKTTSAEDVEGETVEGGSEPSMIDLIDLRGHKRRRRTHNF